MTNVGAWNTKKFRPKIKFIFLEAQKVYDLTKIFGFLKFLKWPFPFAANFFSSKMNATLRDLFKNIIVLGNQGILCSNLHIFKNFKWSFIFNHSKTFARFFELPQKIWPERLSRFDDYWVLIIGVNTNQ